MSFSVLAGFEVDMTDKPLYKSVHNYTKYKLVEMLINKHQGKKLQSLNAIEELAENVLDVLSVAGLKYYQELREEFNEKPKD